MTIIPSIIVGALAGATVGLLAAPQSGEKTRRMIRKNVDQTGKRLNAAFDDAGERVGETVEDLQKRMLEMVEGVNKDTNQRTQQLQKITREMMVEQRASLERGMRRARRIFS